MEINRFKELMNEEGLEVEEKIANKYGYDEMSFVIGSGNTRPTVYESNIVKMNEEQVKDMIVNQIKNGVPDFDPDELTDKDYILRNVTMAIRHSTTDNSILKLKIRGDLEVYFRVKVEVNSNNGDIGSYKLTDEIINKAGLTKQEIYYKAEENTSKESEIISMNEMLKEMSGMDIPEEEGMPRMYVATNKSRVNGAAIIACEDVLENFCREKEIKGVVIIPSSIHEILLLPIDYNFNEDEINNMIQEVNSNEVSENERLSDHVYYYYAG